MGRTSLDVIRDSAGVERVIRDARAAGRASVDLEFLWEKTYAPVPCLVQIAIGDEIYLIDPIEGAPLEPIGELVADPDVLTVMHAPSADLTLLELHVGARPVNLHDVQLIAGFVGLGAGQGLSALLDRVLKVRLDKGEQYTDWSRRPLSGRQLRYAAADVEHLDELHSRLMEKVVAQGRDEWVAEEHARRYGPNARLSQDPNLAWRKVKGQGKLQPADRAVLAALAAWRERTAAERDRPTQWICPDRTLLEIARRRPTNRRDLQDERGLPDRTGGEILDGILDAVQEGENAAPIQLSATPRGDLAHKLEALTPLGQLLVATRATDINLAPSLLATRDQLEGYLTELITGTPNGSTLATGWRHELVGSVLEDLVAGRTALAFSRSRPFLREISI